MSASDNSKLPYVVPLAGKLRRYRLVRHGVEETVIGSWYVRDVRQEVRHCPICCRKAVNTVFAVWEAQRRVDKVLLCAWCEKMNVQPEAEVGEGDRRYVYGTLERLKREAEEETRDGG